MQLIAFDVGDDFVVEADLVVFIVVEANEEGVGKRSSENWFQMTLMFGGTRPNLRLLSVEFELLSMFVKMDLLSLAKNFFSNYWI